MTDDLTTPNAGDPLTSDAAPNPDTGPAIGDGRTACSRCGAPGPSPEHLGIRTGGHSGGATFLFGQLAEIGESVLEVTVYTCRACGHMELFRG